MLYLTYVRDIEVEKRLSILETDVSNLKARHDRLTGLLNNVVATFVLGLTSALVLNFLKLA
mgnify:CR=1 FL=1